MIKPIEAGCLAIVVSRVVPIHEVRVNSRMDWYHKTCDNCRTIGTWWDVSTPFFKTTTAACACCLRRIDGGSPDAEITETDKEKDKCSSI